MMRAALCALLVTAATAVPAAGGDALEGDTPIERSRATLEQLSGFVIDRTITQFGAEFVRYFSDTWRDIDGTAAVDVTIVERPSARWGSIVYIEQNNRPVARVFLYAGRSAAIKPLAVQAARYVSERAADKALADLLMRDPDLGKEELQ